MEQAGPQDTRSSRFQQRLNWTDLADTSDSQAAEEPAKVNIAQVMWPLLGQVRWVVGPTGGYFFLLLFSSSKQALN